jgi:murein peptide amidase A
MAPKKAKPPVKMLPAPSLHSGVRIAFLAFGLRVKRFATSTHLLAFGVFMYLALTIAFTAAFFWPRSVNFSFAEPTCFTNPVWLPNLVAKKQGETFAATATKGLTVAGYPLYSHTTCIDPSKAPAEHITDQLAYRPLGIDLLKKRIRVSSGQLPAVEYKQVLSQPVSTKEPLVFTLNQADRVFDYRLQVKGQTADCTKEGKQVVCDLSTLGLEQSAEYAFSLQRVFNGQPAKMLFEQLADTVGAVLVTGSSVKANETVFNVPSDIKLAFNKEIKSFAGVELNQVSANKRTSVPVTAAFEGRTLTVKLAKPLPRSATFQLSVGSVLAADGGHLPKSLNIRFGTSGGPKVKSANIGSYKVSTSSNIVLSFDSSPSDDQNLSKYISLEVGGKTAGAKLSLNGKAVTINPDGSLPKCTSFTIKVRDGLKNEFGVSGNSAWSYTSRTICQTVFSIGTSVQGRAILAYRFGGGSSRIVYVGGTHGNEKSSVYTLNAWVDYLERNYSSIPSRRTIIVIPNLNPDGFAAGTRTNARNVDLNRNFPANDWKKGVTMPGGTYNPNGGGSKPLSEPESKALANYVLSVSPRLVLTYHAAAGVVIPNDAGDSDKLARAYDQKSNLYYEPASQTGTIFEYDTTGAFEDWLRDKHGEPALLIELWTMGSSEFYKNQPAMSHMVGLP